MGFLPTYDNDLIYREVRDFFTRDELGPHPSYAKIERRANMAYGLTGQSGDITGVRGSNAGNVAEKRLVAENDYLRAKKAIDLAIKGCSAISTIILTMRYIEGRKIWEIQHAAHLSGNASYQKAERYACLEFADAIDYARESYRIPDDVIPSFVDLAEIGRN